MQQLLYIDDSYESRLFISEALSEQFEIDTVPNMTSLVEKLETKLYDGVLIDVYMPELDGFEVLRFLRDHPSGQKMAIFLFTADTTKDLRMKALSAGVSDYLSKLMDTDELTLRIRNGLNKISSSLKTLKLGNLVLDQKVLKVKLEEEDIPLTLTEYKMLNFMLKSYPEISSRDNLMEFIWGDGIKNMSTFNAHLSNLKNKLERWDHIIESKRNLGVHIRLKDELEGDEDQPYR